MRIIDLTGQRFNKLVAIRFDRVQKRHHYWIFKCDCGKEKSFEKRNVTSGHSKSCCGQFPIKHGKAHTRVYGIYEGMFQRCNNPNSPKFNHYGGRGIKLLWPSFETFYADMGEPISPKLTIDRIDNDGNYCKENCRWATQKEQTRNTRRNIVHTRYGQTKCLTEWAEIYGIPQRVAIQRHSNYGWDIEKILSTPVKVHKKRS